jgi:hypothetical protein
MGRDEFVANNFFTLKKAGNGWISRKMPEFDRGATESPDGNFWRAMLKEAERP